MLAELIALLAPPACAACGAPVARPEVVVCPVCLRELPRLATCCPRCALPSHGGRACPGAGGALATSWALTAYTGSARALVRALKFGGRLALAEVMAAQMAAAMPRPPAGAVVVPVPPAPSRRRRRGFDPAALLAEHVAERLGLGLEACLVRRDRGARQVGARRADRRRGDRLRIEALGAPEVALVLDDVHTTGATLQACARALAGAGSATVHGVTYARTL